MSDSAKRAEERRQQIEQAVNELIVDTIRQSWRINTIAWTGVVFGAFALNLLLLIVIAGGR